MREIKFRAWDSEKQQMFYENDNEFLLFRIRDGRVYAVRVGGFFNGEKPIFCETSTIFPMQYTGLHDKNGKEIYEGDIVQNNNKLKLLIVFDKPSAAFKIAVPEIFVNLPLDKDSMEGLEIVGDIYENPELIK